MKDDSLQRRVRTPGIRRVGPGHVEASPRHVHARSVETNDRSRLHHPETNETDDLLVKVASGQFRLYEPGKDPAPIHELVDGDVARE